MEPISFFICWNILVWWTNVQQIMKYVTLTLMHFPCKPHKHRSCFIIISIIILAHFPHYPLIPSKLEAIKWKANQEFVFISV